MSGRPGELVTEEEINFMAFGQISKPPAASAALRQGSIQPTQLGAQPASGSLK